MTRIVTAGAKEPPRAKPAFRANPTEEAVAQLFGAMIDLNLLGWAIAPLAEANARMEPKLRDPALNEHPRRPAYLEAFQCRDQQIRLLERQARPFLAAFAQAWQRLPSERQAAFRAEPNWPTGVVAVVLAQQVFAWFASSGFWLAAGQESPFGWLALVGVATLLRAAFRALGAS